jgi:hypothetical protein
MLLFILFPWCQSFKTKFWYFGFAGQRSLPAVSARDVCPPGPYPSFGLGLIDACQGRNLFLLGVSTNGR